MPEDGPHLNPPALLAGRVQKLVPPWQLEEFPYALGTVTWATLGFVEDLELASIIKIY